VIDPQRSIRLIESFLFYLLYSLPFVSLFNPYHVYATDGALPSILTRNRDQGEVIVLTIVNNEEHVRSWLEHQPIPTSHGELKHVLIYVFLIVCYLEPN
jgi:hypothetical protein